MADTGFEPVKALPADLQSAPFGHSGNLPSTFVSRTFALVGTRNNSTGDFRCCEIEKGVFAVSLITPQIQRVKPVGYESNQTRFN